MARNFLSRAAINPVNFRATHEGVNVITQSIEIPAGYKLGAGDKFYFFNLGAGVVPLSVTLQATDLDSDGTPTLTLDVGYEREVGADVLDFFIDGSTIGQTGGVIRVENGGDDPYADGAFTPLNEPITIVASAATAAEAAASTAGKLTLTVEFVQATASPDANTKPYDYGAAWLASNL